MPSTPISRWIRTTRSALQPRSIATGPHRLRGRALPTKVLGSIGLRDVMGCAPISVAVNGYVTNLLAQFGDYASVGQKLISVVDTDSFWVDGYFEPSPSARPILIRACRQDAAGPSRRPSRTASF